MIFEEALQMVMTTVNMNLVEMNSKLQIEKEIAL